VCEDISSDDALAYKSQIVLIIWALWLGVTQGMTHNKLHTYLNGLVALPRLDKIKVVTCDDSLV
jgi:hypothetical protein